MRVLITGIGGLIGSNFAHWLRANKPEVEVIGVDNWSGGYPENVPGDVLVEDLDLCDTDDVESFFDANGGFDYIFHFAAYAAEGLSPYMPAYCFRQNLLPMANLATQALRTDCQRFIFTSSMAVYGHGRTPFREEDDCRPIDPYGIAKMAAERHLEVTRDQFGMDYTVIRPHNVIGVRQNLWDRYRNVIGIWMHRHLHGKPLSIYGDGTQRRAFTVIDDILPCLWRAAESPACSGETINLGGIVPKSIREMAEIFDRAVGGDTRIQYFPARHEVHEAFTTWAKSVDLLGFEHKTDLEEGLRQMWDWAREQPNRWVREWGHYELRRPEWLPAHEAA